jgi:hypothetical protein
MKTLTLSCLLLTACATSNSNLNTRYHTFGTQPSIANNSSSMEITNPFNVAISIVLECDSVKREVMVKPSTKVRVEQGNYILDNCAVERWSVK